MPNSKKFFLLVTSCALLVTIISGCATIPTKEALPTYQLNGTSYYALATLCESRKIDWQFDTFSRNITLTGNAHRINLRVGDKLVLVDGRAQLMHYPVDFYQGAIVVPYRFKEDILDVLFKKEVYLLRKEAITLPKIKKVVIDPGHGGHDPGAIGRSGLREKDVNLDIAKRVSSILRANGIEVVMTRSSDKFIPLSRRVETANNSRADLFVSIHANANRVRSLNGFEIYYVAPTVSDSKRASEAARYARLTLDNAFLASQSHNLKAILWDMIYTSSRAQSIELSRAICKTIDDNLSIRVIGVKSARYEVLRGARMPAILIEVGFLSNREEERRLKNGYYRQQLADGIVKGIGAYACGQQVMEASRR